MRIIHLSQFKLATFVSLVIVVEGTLAQVASFGGHHGESNSSDWQTVWHQDLGVAKISNSNGSPLSSSSSLSIKLPPQVGKKTLRASGLTEEFERPLAARNQKVGGEVCNFGGRRLRVAVSPQPPLVNCLQNLYGDWLCNGSNIEVINMLERKLNFQAEWLVLANTHLVEPAGRRSDDAGTAVADSKINTARQAKLEGASRGVVKSNYTGVLGLVSSGRAWLSANGIMRTEERKRHLILSEPFDSFRLHFLLSKSVRDHDHIFIKPFNSHAWLAILLSSALIVPIFYLINSTSSHYSMLDDKFLSRLSILNCLHYLIVQACQENRNRSRQRHLGARPHDWQGELISNASGTVRSSRESAVESPVVNSSAASYSWCRFCRPISVPPLAMITLQALQSRRNGFRSSQPQRQHRSDCTRAKSRQLSYSSDSSSSSFDDEIDRMVFMGGALNLEPKVISVRSETRRRRKALKRKWIQERTRVKRLGRLKRKSGFFRVAYIIWYVVSSLASQGGETEDLPQASSTRILVAFWWLYLIVICSIHSGILTAILTFPKQSDFIQTLDDYLALDEGERMALKLAVDKQSESAHLLLGTAPNHAHNSPLQALLSGASSGTGAAVAHVDFQRHRQRILDDVWRGQSALIEEKSTINLIITQEYFDHKPPKCQFKASRFPIGVIPMSLVISPRMPSLCFKVINRSLKQVMQTGLVQEWRRKYEAQGNDCLNTVIINAGDVDKIQLKHVVLAFWLLALGIALGALFLVLEVIWLCTADDNDNTDSSDSDCSMPFDLLKTSTSLKKQTANDFALSTSTLWPRSSSSSSSLSSLSDSSCDGSLSSRRLRLGHRLSRLANRSLKSLKHRQFARSKLKRNLTKDRKRRLPAMPPNPLSPLIDITIDSGELFREGSLISSNLANKPDKRKSLRVARRRAQRLKRTLDLVKRLHEGKIYSALFLKVSGQVQSRARRASHAIIDRLTSTPAPPTVTKTANATTTKNRAQIQPIGQLARLGSLNVDDEPETRQHWDRQQQSPDITKRGRHYESRPSTQTATISSSQLTLDGPIRRRRSRVSFGGSGDCTTMAHKSSNYNGEDYEDWRTK